MSKSVFSICDAVIQPSEKATLALPLPEQYSCSPMYMPIKVINGSAAGPCFLAFSTLNGDEFNGIEILNQLFEMVDSTKLKGTLILVPVLNVYGLTHYPKISPSGNSIIDAFPGNQAGNYSERVADVFTQEVLRKVDFCIECQTGSINHEILPQVYCDYNNSKLKTLARVFQAPVITEVDTSIGALRQTCFDLNIPFLVYQAGEAMRLDNAAIQIGIKGIMNVLKKLEMIEGQVEIEVNAISSKDDEWILSPASGMLTDFVSLGERVKKGDKLGRISDPFSHANTALIKSCTDGIIVGINRSPLIQEGSSVFKIASFIDNKKAEAMIEEWDETQIDLDNGN